MNLRNLAYSHDRNRTAIQGALDELGSAEAARQHEIPRVLNYAWIAAGKLNNGVQADLELLIADRRRIFIRVVEGFDSRPKRRLRRKIERMQKEAQVFAPALFIFARETWSSIRRKIVDAIKVALASIDRKWIYQRPRRHRGISNCFVSRDFSKFPYRSARAA